MSEKTRFQIVPAAADHLDALAELERACFPTPWSRAMLAEELENDCACLLAAVDGAGAVIGYAGVQVVLDEGYITNVAVLPAYRRQGVAEALMGVFLRFGEAHQLAFLTLEVRPSNHAAILLYGKLGFRGAGRRRNYYTCPQEDAIIMTKEFSHGTAAARAPSASDGL